MLPPIEVPSVPRRRLRAGRAPGWVLACLALSAACALPPSLRTGPTVAPVREEPCWPGPPGSDPRLCPPNDPAYPTDWEFLSSIPPEIDRARMHPAEVGLGSIGFSLDAAWQHSVGRPDVVIAVLDSGVRWYADDLLRKFYLNAGELPPPQGAAVHDANADGVFDIDDYAGDPRVGDRNANGRVDPGDLIRAFSDCRDDDGNGYVDDISGYDFFSGEHCGNAPGDNDAADATDFGHGTGIAATAAGETNNGIDDSGVCPACRVLPVRVGDSFVVDANRFARGVLFAVTAGADVIASALGSYNNTPAARYAVDHAYAHDVALIASAADEFSYHHNYPSVYAHTLYVNAIRYNHSQDFTKATTFWGLNPCTNFGARVGITVPATSCSSGATSRLAGVAGLVHSAALDAGIDDLRAEEVYQLLQTTADDLDNRQPDWGTMLYPARPGFDQIYGYGRLNALRAVTATLERRLPPVVDLSGPRWFAVISPVDQPRLPLTMHIELPRAQRADYRLEYALGVEPAEQDYTLIDAGVVSRPRATVGAVLDFGTLPLPAGPPPRNREERDRYSVTLRLRATDERGLVAEARRSFFVVHDPSWKGSAPLDLGASGEAEPLMQDLDGDGRDEVILPTADGVVRILGWDGGWQPRATLLLDAGPPLGPGVHDPSLGRETIVRGAVVGDLHGHGEKSIVVVSREGKIYVFDSRGRRVAPFPVSLPADAAASAAPGRVLEQGSLTRPVLAELDRRPGLEILVTGLDGQLHAWRGDGQVLEGFPVATEAAPRGAAGKIVSRPAVGDLDGDGSVEIIFGSNGLKQGVAGVYAVRRRGRADPLGPFVPGWDAFPVTGLRALLPTLAEGVAMEPLLFDVDNDGDDEVLLYAVTADRVLLVDHQPGVGPRVRDSYSMNPGSEASGSLAGMSFLAGTGSGLLADTDADGMPELYVPLLPYRMLTLRAKPGIPLDVPLALGGWPLQGERDRHGQIGMLPHYPRRMEDLMVFARPAAIDVDGDGRREVLMGSGGYLLHAFGGDGGEAEGFPKFTGGWIFSAPSAGDLDGDGGRDLVAVTREGYLFTWELDRPPGPPAPSARTAQPRSDGRHPGR